MELVHSSRIWRLIGVAANLTPVIPGSWRLLESAFYRWFVNMHVQVDVPLNAAVTVSCDLSDNVQFYMWCLRERYESRFTRYFISLLRPGAVFVDIGANVGYYSLVAAPRVGPDGRIFAFEPMSEPFARLADNIRRNRLTQVTPLKLALVALPQTAVMGLVNRSNSGTASLGLATVEAAQTESVECSTLDLLAESWNFDRLDLVKIDVEGFEQAVLLGARNTLTKFRPVLLVEVNDGLQRRAGSTRDGLYRWLEGLDYEPFRVRRSGRIEPIKLPEDGGLIVFRPRATAVP